MIRTAWRNWSCSGKAGVSFQVGFTVRCTWKEKKTAFSSLLNGMVRETHHDSVWFEQLEGVGAILHKLEHLFKSSVRFQCALYWRRKKNPFISSLLHGMVRETCHDSLWFEQPEGNRTILGKLQRSLNSTFCLWWWVVLEEEISPFIPSLLHGMVKETCHDNLWFEKPEGNGTIPRKLRRSSNSVFRLQYASYWRRKKIPWSLHYGMAWWGRLTIKDHGLRSLKRLELS